MENVTSNLLRKVLFTPSTKIDIDVEPPTSYVLATTHWHRAVYQRVDPKKLQPYLGWRPIKVIQKTLEHTTQMARMIIRTPLRRHVKSRIPWMNVNRLDETVSTDPMFANCKSMYHGYIGAQVYYGCVSHNINVYGLKSKGEFPRTYRDFIREHGAPSTLRRDNAKEEQSQEVQDIHRDLLIKDAFSEPHNPQQNPVESGAIRFLKQASHAIMDRCGAPDSAWYFCIKYLADIHSICYDKTIGTTPWRRRHGTTPDISAFLQFSFWQRVLYLDHESSWPASHERPGYWVGVCDNIGDALTYWIVDDQSKQLLARSVVRPYQNNQRVRWDPAFANLPLKSSAHNGGDIKPTQKAL